MANLKKNVILNVAGAVIPLFVAIVTTPLYLKVIGAPRFGTLTLVWLFTGYYGLLNLGISRASVHLLSKVPNNDPVRRQQVFFSALWPCLLIGLAGMAIMYPVAYEVFGWFRVEDPILRGELTAAIPWLCLLVPLTLCSAIGYGALEARERFDLANLLQIVGTIATQVGPIFVAYRLGPQVENLVIAIVLVRVIITLVLYVTLKVVFPLNRLMGWDRATLKQLLTYGAWSSVSGLIAPVLDTLDRFVIGAKLSVTDVAMYAIPYSIADKIRILPIALGRAAFPQLSRLQESEALALYQQLVKRSLTVMTPLVLMVMVSSQHLLYLWVDIPSNSPAVTVAIVLLCGAWFNSMAVVPFIYLTGRGRPNLTAKIHLIELLPFAAAVYVLVDHYGIIGAALAWAGRMLIDGILLFFFARNTARTWAHLFFHAAILTVAALICVTYRFTMLEAAAMSMAIGVALLHLNKSLMGDLWVRVRRALSR